jgi:MEDS: MEthanogen/methylotroph, DcmR Sensory domain
MSNQPPPISTQPAPVHSVHLYEQEADLITRLCAIVGTSLRLGDAVLVVATPEHRSRLVSELEKADIDLRDAVRDGRYIMLDASETLSTFMLNGSPDATRFSASVGKVLADARIRAKSKNHRLTVFGEMVAVLWDSGQKEAALALEAIWNSALADGTFHLHCAYPRTVFSDATELHSVCDVHSHVLQ